MTWVATGCCVLLAGYILYKHAARERDQRVKSDTSTTAAHGLPPTLDAPLAARDAPLLAVSQPDPLTKPDPREHGDPSFMDKVDETAVLPAPTVPDTRGTAPAPLLRDSSNARRDPPSLRPPPSLNNGFMRPPPSAAASLRAPAAKMSATSSLTPTSSVMPPGRQTSRKVVLEPGHSPLDWAALTSDPNSRLRGKDAAETLLRVPPSRLKQQNGRKGRDAWTVYQGKVYNITPYVPFHPGGQGEIMRGAGKDSARLFMETHPWVNWDAMLGECMVGILVSEEDALDSRSGGLDDMD